MKVVREYNSFKSEYLKPLTTMGYDTVEFLHNFKLLRTTEIMA